MIAGSRRSGPFFRADFCAAFFFDAADFFDAAVPEALVVRALPPLPAPRVRDDVPVRGREDPEDVRVPTMPRLLGDADNLVVTPETRVAPDYTSTTTGMIMGLRRYVSFTQRPAVRRTSC